jgi:hypothetical protein
MEAVQVTAVNNVQAENKNLNQEQTSMNKEAPYLNLPRAKLSACSMSSVCTAAIAAPI